MCFTSDKNVNNNVVFLVLSLLFLLSDSRKTPPPDSSPYSSPVRPETTPFRPSIVVVIGVLTTMFSITFLMLLYAKHCKRVSGGGGNAGGYYGNYGGDARGGNEGRKNSGIDRVVIETLPIFRFASLSGQKEGLECAVCLARFEPSEVLRLLPKCKHAFHVECVDTWLDAHSTCPLCRYRVDPEDILLVHDNNVNNHQLRHGGDVDGDVRDPEESGGGEDVVIRRVSGRHSSAGERGTDARNQTTSSFFRRSLDGSRKRSDTVAVGCFDRYQRKDGLLLLTDEDDRTRFEHRIIVSSNGGAHQRWSDLQPSDLLYLRSEMIISDSRRFSSASGSRPKSSNASSGRNVINGRSMSEITGLNRFSDRGGSNGNGTGGGGIGGDRRQRERQVGVARRWLAWVSSLSQTTARTATVA